MLARGLEYAGAKALLMPLWNTNGKPLAIFLDGFYKRAGSGSNLAQAIQAVMADVRAEYLHPFEWASFVLRGHTDRN